MVSMMNVWESMEMPMFGRLSLNSSIIFPWQLLLKARSSVSMVVSHHPSTLSTRSDNLTECRKFLTKDLFAISCGLIPMTAAAGVSHPEEPVTLLVRIFRSSSITLTDSNWYLVLINLWWTATTGLTNAMLWLYSQLQTIVTDVVTKLRLWKWTSSWSTLSCSSIQHLVKQNPTSVSALLIIFSDKDNLSQ